MAKNDGLAESGGMNLELKTGEMDKGTTPAPLPPQNDVNTLASLKQKNKYLRKAYTQNANLLRTQMENQTKFIPLIQHMLK